MDGGNTAARKKSEQRQRQKQIKIRCTSDEFNEAAAKAAQAGLSTSAYARASMLGYAGARAQKRLPVDAQLIRQVLAQLARYGNNWNQVAYQLNKGDAPRMLQDQVEHEIGNLRKIEDLLLMALGKNPQPASPEGSVHQ